MNFPRVTAADWRAQVDKDLAGGSFEKALVRQTLEGLAIAPLYTDLPNHLAREPRSRGFQICMAGDPEIELANGADAAWLDLDALNTVLAEPTFQARTFVLRGATLEALRALAARPGPKPTLVLEADARGPVATLVESAFPGSTSALVSTLAYHDAGADAADELALALSAGVAALGALLAAGLTIEIAARQVGVQIAVGRDTFLELCKLRALRTCWGKLLTASGAANPPPLLVHAVCSSRTLSVRDPWVNMLRVTTQVFAAVLGGADLVTPATFDQASGLPSDLGRRVARNTGLVLREESQLGRVIDPAGGSYYLETLTDALARAAWQRFRALEKEGGIVSARTSGRLAARLEASWQKRLEQIAKRRAPIVGVSEFANLDEVLARSAATPHAGHRDAETFEALRARADAKAPPPEAVLVTLGSLAESRPRAGFAAGFFTAGGIRTRESTVDEKAPLVCLCGSDERYAAEAASRARALKAAGCERVLLAGRPGALEASLREAGIDGFVFAGCDAVATLGGLLTDHVERPS